MGSVEPLNWRKLISENMSDFSPTPDSSQSDIITDFETNNSNIKLLKAQLPEVLENLKQIEDDGNDDSCDSVISGIDSESVFSDGDNSDSESVFSDANTEDLDENEHEFEDSYVVPFLTSLPVSNDISSDEDCKNGSQSDESEESFKIGALKAKVTPEPLKISRIRKFYSVLEIKH